MVTATEVFGTDYTNLEAVIKLARKLQEQSNIQQYVVKLPNQNNYNITMQLDPVEEIIWPKKLTLAEMREKILATNGKEFAIRFKKRTTGELREMICKTKYDEALTENPSKPGVDFRANRLIGVFDVVKQEYRSIPLEGVLAIKTGEEWETT